MNIGLGQLLLILIIGLLFFGNFPKIISNLKKFITNLKK
jgi:Sec-independent protein translocase protein TatA